LLRDAVFFAPEVRRRLAAADFACFDSPVRRGRVSFALQHIGGGARPFRARLGRLVAGPLLRIARSLLARTLAGLARFRRLQLHPGAARFGEPDGDRLLGRPGAVFALANMLDLFMDEFSGLRGGRLAFAGVLACAFDGFLFRHTVRSARLLPPFGIDPHQKLVS
jgi:hypothetical protein